ncbi:MAG: L-fucose/L-arabinose isomerase family protein [Geminicoccaceae bacterium]
MSSAAPRIGVIPLVRATFDLGLAEEMRGKAWSALEATGYHVTGPRGLLVDTEGAMRAAQSLAGDDLDLLLFLQLTFTDAAMTVRLARAVGAPMVLWAFPEPRTGGRLRLNSLCGINLAAHALARTEIACRYLHAAPDDPAVAERLTSFVAGEGWPAVPEARAVPDSDLGAAALASVRHTRIGLVGRHPDGFDTCRFDPAELDDLLGITVDKLSQSELFERAGTLDAAEVAPVAARARSELAGLGEVDASAADKSLRLYAALRDLAKERGLAGMAIRCWPEPFTEYGCAVCRPMGMLTEDGIPCACEADVYGTATNLLLQALAGEPAWLVDLVDLDPVSDTGVLWHCGLAPCSMADPATPPRADVHSNRKLPLLAAFACKPGRVTLARLSQARNRAALVMAGGTVIEAPMSFAGTSGVIRFDLPVGELLDRIMGYGVEHHFGMAYGDYAEALHAVAGHLGIPVVELTGRD